MKIDKAHGGLLSEDILIIKHTSLTSPSICCKRKLAKMTKALLWYVDGSFRLLQSH